MSIKVIADVLVFSEARYGSRLVLLSLAEFCDDDGVCWPKVSQLAKRTRMCERGVRYCLRSLESAGDLCTRRGGAGLGDRSEYHVILGKRGKNCPLCQGAKSDTSRGQNPTDKGAKSDTLEAPLLNEPSGNRQRKEEGGRFSDEGTFPNFLHRHLSKWQRVSPKQRAWLERLDDRAVDREAYRAGIVALILAPAGTGTLGEALSEYCAGIDRKPYQKRASVQRTPVLTPEERIQRDLDLMEKTKGI